MLLDIWKNYKFWKFFFWFLIIGSILGGIFAKLSANGILDRKPFCYKYCYFSNENNINEKYSDVNFSRSIKVANEVKDYYLLISKPIYDSIGFIDNSDGIIPKFTKVAVLKYKNNSSIALIRVYLRGRRLNKIVGYIPAITLHDTIPHYRGHVNK